MKDLSQTQQITSLLSIIDSLNKQLAQAKQKYKKLKFKVNYKSDDDDQTSLNLNSMIKKEKTKQNLTQDQTRGVNVSDTSFSFNEPIQYINISQKKGIDNVQVNQSFISDIQGQDYMGTMIEPKKIRQNSIQNKRKSINGQDDSFSINQSDINNHQINNVQKPLQINNMLVNQSMISEVDGSDYMALMNPPTFIDPMLQNVEQEQEKAISQISVKSEDSGFSSILIAALLSKLGLGDITPQRLEQLKDSIRQMRLQEQNNPELQQVSESGTFLLNFKQISQYDIDDLYISKITQWNRFLITDMQIGSQKEQSEINRLFSIQWQNLQYLYIERQDDTLINQKNQLTKKVSDLDLQFLTKYQVNKNLKQLILRGQTMGLITAITLCDIKFLRLKQLIIQFENQFSNSIVSVFLQSKFQKINKKCKIRFHTPNGKIDQRFKPICNRIRFQRAESSDEQYGEPPY